MNDHWTDIAPEGEVFEDYWGNEGARRVTCISCTGTGEYYHEPCEPCFNCGGYGWVCVKDTVIEQFTQRMVDSRPEMG